MNTGHDGSLTTIHSNTPKDAISRLATLVIMAGTELPERAIKEQIVGAVDLIVQTNRFSDGSRKVTYITEITTDDNNEIVLKDIFTYKQTGIKDGKVIGKMSPTGDIPTFYDEIFAHGMTINKEIFNV
ncbi:MAG: hypothetical protein A2252_01545 [Elusimicrobia bacterium RIFOXYA2_FULL_39_19]|nr:MAG: hypothetical protein A2252_01545 [Elusimicrobia bacterium RIFOXYA2_FULL_39_19]